MNANQIARLMHLSLKAYVDGEINLEELTDLCRSLTEQARSAGFAEESAQVYWEMCQTWLNRQTA